MVPSENKYLYNGKEIQDELLGSVNLDWYDYGARMYDPALGRFHTMDPLSETYSFQSPFAYAANNPISNIDFMGMSPLGVGGNVNYTINGVSVSPDIFNDMAGQYDDDPKKEEKEKKSDGRFEYLVEAIEIKKDNTNISLDDTLGKGFSKEDVIALLPTGDIAIIADGFSTILFTADEIIANIPSWGKAVKIYGAQVATMADLVNIGYQGYLGFTGQISPELSTYRMTFSAASILATIEVGAACGGGIFGACAGLMVGVLGATGELSYNVMKSGLNNMIQDYYDRSTIPGGVESGWSGLSPIEFQ